MLVDALIDACLDSLKLLPFLFLTYLFMEWLEHGAGEKFENAVSRSGVAGPFIGALLGVVPQCGFSGAAATLYAGRVVTLGTLVSVFLATSDEMLPVMISQAASPLLILKILGIKVACGMAIGFVLDLALRASGRTHVGFASKHAHEGHEGNDIHVICEAEGCECAHGCDCCSGTCERAAAEGCVHAEHDHGHEHEHGHSHEHGHDHAHGGHVNWKHLALAALKHSLQVTVFVFVICLVLNLVSALGGEQQWQLDGSGPYLSVVVCGVLGFVPNCAISVGLTELYLDGALSGGAMLSGLLVNAGIGLLVLLRTNNDVRENLRICALLLVVGVAVGCAVQALGIL